MSSKEQYPAPPDCPARTYERFEEWSVGEVGTEPGSLLKPGREGDLCRLEEAGMRIASRDGFQGCLFPEELESFRLDCGLRLEGKGKCGLLLRVDPESHDGYYLSLDLLKGVAQMRAWGTNEDETGEDMMCFETLQTAYWFNETPGRASISLLAFGSYLELSIEGRVVLSLADRQFNRGRVGVYLETAEMMVEGIRLRRMKNPAQVDDQLVSG